MTIVESTAPSWRPGEVWQLSAEPVVDIGALEGDPRYELYQAWGAVRTSTGTIIIANRGSHELRWYDGTGTFIRSVGTKGGGPGEFEDLRWIGLLPGDSLITYDMRQRRLSVFDSAGAFVRAGTIRGPLYFADDVFGDGSLLMYRWNPGEDGVQRRSATIVRLGSDAVVRDTIATVPGPELEIETRPPRADGSVVTTMRSLMFAHDAVMDAFGSLALVGSQDRYEIDVLDTTGRLVASVRVPAEPVRVTAAHIEAHLDQVLASVPDRDRPARRSSFEAVPHAATFPAYDAIVADTEGNLWVEVYRLPGDSRPRWQVFDPSHRLLGTVAFPDRLTVSQIGSDYVLGHWSDDLGVEHVRLYALRKPR